MINFFIWNVKGIGNKESQKMVHQVIKEYNVKLIAIIEPKINFDARFMTRILGYSHVVANTNNKIWLF
ncbi:hypothetical protein CDL12_23811 [Handroanthus impetiginosus]|uniref:Uncharacterized protein n=1 Tax=Handroanthus impetiginosus TaxID=429701 RepID=A0A2G9GF72_9LAMI|nr:hypothetical protein CDL12_23811 [Handroanthus impetiginosus]